MADYPNLLHGVNYGDQNSYMPQQQRDFANRRTASSTTSMNPAYPSRLPNAPDYAAYNMANAQFNSNIPPFGPAFSAPLSFPPGTNVPPYYQMPPAWNASTVQPPNHSNWPQQPFNFVQNQPAYNHSAQHRTVQNQPVFGLPRLDTNTQQQTSINTPPGEEGELIDGAFVDSHGSRTSNPRASRKTSGLQAAQHVRADQYGSPQNTAPRENVHKDSAGKTVPITNGAQVGQSSDRGRQKFNSPRNIHDHYSPNSPPRLKNSFTKNGRSRTVVHTINLSPTEPAKDSYQSPKASHPQILKDVTEEPASLENGREGVLDAPANIVVENLEMPDDDRYSPELETSSTPDMRVLAQHAILNLMPAKVQFQDYIEEGIDESLMHVLFEGLGMPQTRKKADPEVVPPKKALSQDISGYTNGKIQTSTAEAHEAKSRLPENNLPKKPNLPNKPNSTGVLGRDDSSVVNGKEVPKPAEALPLAPRTDVPGSAAPSGEERKDRIARMLAEKSTQAAALKAEKDRQLSIKIENLKKSREARALKNDTAKKTPVTLVTPVTAGPKFAEATPVSSAQTQTPVTQQATQPPAQPPAVPNPRVSPAAVFKQDVDVAQQISSAKSLPSVLPALKDIVPIRPSIPGLTLTATAPKPPTNINALPATPAPIPAVQQRKRPVAADFDEPAPPNAYKRPFGQSRVDKPLVIDVSEDEDSDGDEGTAMDIDQPESSQGLNIQSSKIGPIVRSPVRAPDQESRKSRAPTGTPVHSTPTPQSHPKPSPDVRSIESKIAELHKQIAEREAKRKAKASANRSGSQTPVTAEATIAQQNIIKEAIAEKAQISAELERLLEGADELAASETKKQVDAAAKEEADAAAKEQAEAAVKEKERVEQMNVEEIKKRDADRKRKRRSDIQSTLPTVHAEVERHQQRLEELRAEAAKEEAAIQKYLEDKQKLENEMSNLGDEPEEQLQIQQTQQKLTLTTPESHSKPATPHGVLDPAPEDSIPKTSLSTRKDSSQASQNGESQEKQDVPANANFSQHSQDIDMLDVPPHQEKNGAAEDNTNLPGQAAPSVPEEQQHPIESDPTSIASRTEHGQELSNSSNAEQISTTIPHTHSPMNDLADQALEAALQQASAQAEAESHASPDTEMVNTHAPNPNQLQPDSSASSQAMEDELQDYSSASIQDTTNQEQFVNDNSDAYEPPEASPLACDDVPPVVQTETAFSSASHASVDELSNIDINASGLSATNLQTIDSVEPLGSKSGEQVDDLQTSAIEEDGDESLSKHTSSFTPYESPLRQFRGYRFNQNFSEEVAGGFRSTTYSHQIDPEKEFCPFELGGGTCNDTTCKYQHFKDLNLGDDVILLQLGDPEAFNSKPDVKDSFIKGLRSVLQDLKTRRIRDFPTIASEIAAFRNKFDSENLVL